MADKIDTTHTLMDRKLILYRRERSSIWQCRFKVGGIWQRKSTKEHDFKTAEQVAQNLLIESEIRKQSNLPILTRKFKDVAKLAITRLENDLKSGNGKAIYKDYIRVIKDYLIPILGRRNIDNIDYKALDDFDSQRIIKMGKKPSQSTLLTQNAALNRVLDEAQMRGLINDAIRPTLSIAGRKSVRRAAFTIDEVLAIDARFGDWIERARTEKSRELRALLRDYVDVMLDTGARPGNELLDLKWKQITYTNEPITKRTGVIDESDDRGDEIVTTDFQHGVVMVVSGKTGRREIIGNRRTVRALQRIAMRNYGIEKSIANPLANLTNKDNDDYVFRISKQHAPTSFPRLFSTFLKEHELLIDPNTEQHRVFYSLRHTHATLELTHDKVPIYTLAIQMGTSVAMIEKHYSHLKVIHAKEQLRGKERERLLQAGSLLDSEYAYKGR